MTMRRLLIIVLGLGLAIMASRDAALAYWRSDNGHTAPALFSGDAGVRLRMAEGLNADPQRFAAAAPDTAAAAREVLRATPLSVMAMRQLAVTADLAKPGSGRAFLALAERITRRDLPSELLSIDYAANDGDAAAAIRHYDHALSTYPEAYGQLLPIIASQLGEPGVRQAMLTHADRPWLRHFVANAVDYDVPPAALLDLYRDIGARVPAADLQTGAIRLVRWLVANRQFGALSPFAAGLPGLPADAFAPIGFNSVTTDQRYAPLGWTLINDATIETQSDGDALQVRIEPGSAALAAWRMTLLQPGTYRIAQTIGHQAGEGAAEAEWLVTCPDDPRRQLLQVQGSGGVLTIPAGCPSQDWQLRVSGASTQTSSQVRIAALALTAP